MQYQKGSIGRVIVAKVEHGDDLLLELNKLLREEQIASGIMLMIGALQTGAMVVGPESDSVPPEPVWKEFSEGREVLAMATIFSAGGEPIIHLHGALGRGENTWTGCIRRDAQVYLVVEVVLLELLGTSAIRTLDTRTGLDLLGFA